MLKPLSNQEYKEIFQHEGYNRSETVREIERNVRLLLEGEKNLMEAGEIELAIFYREQAELGKWQAIIIAGEEKARRSPYFEKGELGL